MASREIKVFEFKNRNSLPSWIFIYDNRVIFKIFKKTSKFIKLQRISNVIENRHFYIYFESVWIAEVL